MTQPEGSLYLVADLGIEAKFLVVDPTDIIQRQHVAGKFYERKELTLLETYLPAGRTPAVVDVGANVGNHTIFFASRGCEVTSFEADPYTFEILTENIEANGLRQLAMPINIGLSNRKEMLAIHRRAHNLGATILRLGKQARFTMDQEQPARCDTLDSFALDRVDFLKIDVEGMELKVLEGARATLARHRPLIFVEVFDHQLEEMQAWASANGYRMQGTGTSPGAAYHNWLMFPEGSR